MRRKFEILTIATALAGLGVGVPAEAAKHPTPSSSTEPSDGVSGATSGTDANRFVALGEDLLGFLVTQREDGTVVAQHRSHYSHSSHSSHRSHYSSR